MAEKANSRKSGKEKSELNNMIYGYTYNLTTLEEENRMLKETVSKLKEQLDQLRRPPLVVGEVKDTVGDNVILQLPTGNLFFVEVSPSCTKLRPGDFVLAEQKNLTILERMHSAKRFNVERFVIMEKPDVSWQDVGGLDKQIQEIQEVVELPLKKPELFRKVGIQPPKGILLYGEPGTGKTLLAKAVASSTKSTFIEIVGSELVQKFIGEGAKMVNEIFQLAKEKAPSIIFIDELDAIASKRVDIGTSGEREVQRTFMQLLAEIDGFKHLGNVKVIGCTNRKDILDPAVLRPGRLDRHINIPLPNNDGRREIFRIHTRRMRLVGVNADIIIRKMEGFSGADIKAVCTEAGYFAIRANRTIVRQEDFVQAIAKVRYEETLRGMEHASVFG